MSEWVDKLSLKDRLKLQKFMVQLYGMEDESGKDK